MIFICRYVSISADTSIFQLIIDSLLFCQYTKVKPIVFRPNIGSADIAEYLQVPIIVTTLVFVLSYSKIRVPTAHGSTDFRAQPSPRNERGKLFRQTSREGAVLAGGSLLKEKPPGGAV